MSAFLLPVTFVTLVFAAIVLGNERFGLLRVDRFPSRGAKLAAYVWLYLFLLLLAVEISYSSAHPATAKMLEQVSFVSLFGLHFILIIFLAGWWLLSGRPRLGEFFNVRRERAGEMLMMGFAIGVGGWALTIMMAVIFAAILKATGLIHDPQPSPMIGWMAARPIWQKASIVFSAMTVEEAFFRGWLQKRVGLIASTILFAMAHLGLGQPLLLIGVALISLVIGFAFYRTKNLLPGIIAHGVFDAIQLFVIIPIAFNAIK